MFLPPQASRGEESATPGRSVWARAPNRKRGRGRGPRFDESSRRGEAESKDRKESAMGKKHDKRGRGAPANRRAKGKGPAEWDVEKIGRLADLMESALKRLDAWLPPESLQPDWGKSIAFRWRNAGGVGFLESLPHPHSFSASLLRSVDVQAQKLIANTERFLRGLPANNVLLTGARGTGKSSLVKSLLHAYAKDGLRMIEVDRNDLATLPQLLAMLEGRSEKFIVFCDDLSFDAGDDAYKALKTALDGGLSVRCENVLVYATSNRRHLLPEFFGDNNPATGAPGEEIHPNEAIEERVALSDRFGLWLSFYPFGQDDYLAAARSWVEQAGLAFGDDARAAALLWAQTRGNRSGRVAYQFACDWVGTQAAAQRRNA